MWQPSGIIEPYIWFMIGMMSLCAFALLSGLHYSMRSKHFHAILNATPNVWCVLHTQTGVIKLASPLLWEFFPKAPTRLKHIEAIISHFLEKEQNAFLHWMTEQDGEPILLQTCTQEWLSMSKKVLNASLRGCLKSKGYGKSIGKFFSEGAYRDGIPERLAG